VKDYHKQFYFGVIAKLQHLTDGRGNVFSMASESGKPRFHLAYEPRLEVYRHNYLRDGHLAKRDILIVAQEPHRTRPEDWGRNVVLVSLKRHSDIVTIYEKAVQLLYPDDTDEAMRELHEILKKFYEVRIEERSGWSKVDLSTERHENNLYVYDFS
jgi:hypothetical protein